MVNTLMVLSLVVGYIKPVPNWQVGFFVDPIAYGLTVHYNSERGNGMRGFFAFRVGEKSYYLPDSNDYVIRPYHWIRWGLRLYKYFVMSSYVIPYMSVGLEGRSKSEYYQDGFTLRHTEQALSGGVYSIGVTIYLPFSRRGSQGIAMDFEVNSYYLFFRKTVGTVEDEDERNYGGIGAGWGIYYTW